MRARLLLVVLACSCGTPLAGLLAEQAKGNEIQTAAVPTGDGAKYVSVTSEDPVARSMLRARWKREAENTCEGDYLVLSESASERRAEGRTTGTMHEGFVRCVSPESTIDAKDKPPTDGGRMGPEAAKL